MILPSGVPLSFKNVWFGHQKYISVLIFFFFFCKLQSNYQPDSDLETLMGERGENKVKKIKKCNMKNAQKIAQYTELK